MQRVHKSTDKVDQIIAMPDPSDVGQLRSYLGMLYNYYRKYLANLATVLTPFTASLEKGCKFVWGSEAAKAFKTSKEMLRSSGFWLILIHHCQSL